MPSAKLFVRLLLPIVPIAFSSLFAFSFFSLKAFRAAQPCTCDIHILKYVRLFYLGASFTEAYYYFPSIKLNAYVSSSAYVPFLRHYMHRYDLSFGQAGFPGSYAYALRSR